MEDLTRGLFVLFGNAVPLACIAGAVILLLHDRDGWGWLMFVALCTHVSYSWKRGPQVDEEDEEDCTDLELTQRAQRKGEPR